MFLITLFLLQQAPRISILVIVASSLALIIGVFLVVHFYRRFKATEKEPEEDWQAGMHSLFVNPTASTEPKASTDWPIRHRPQPLVQPVPQTRVTRTELRSASAEVQKTSQPEQPQAEPEKPQAIPEPVSEPPVAARVLGPEPAPPEEKRPLVTVPESASEAPHESPFDDEVLSGLESTAHRHVTETTPLKSGDESTTTRVPVADRTSQVRASRPTEAFDADRVKGFQATSADERDREQYFRPAITPIKQRESYEAPHIRPLEPREQQTAVEAKRPVEPVRAIDATRPPEAARPPGPPRAAEPLTPAKTTSIWGSVRANEVAAPMAARSVSRSTVPAGSVLGIPAEASSAPLRLGSPSRPTADVGIEALVNYGKDSDPGGGRGGTIVLAVTVLLLGVAILSYFYWPGFHGKVNAFVARARGVSNTAPPSQPKANIFPSRSPEVVKNMVKARGAVDNIADPPETLENLHVEVSLQRGSGGQPETRQVDVSPSALAPGQRGIFEFEYDGKRDTGFVGYRIVKLWSGETEIKFTAPGQNH